jgi:pimeloyl-[acyl-carrier protein] methyl ester esterase
MTAISSPTTTSSPAAEAFQAAERRLLDEYGIAARSRRLALADPALHVRVLETGAGRPLVLLHGSGMSAPTWAPMLARMDGRRVHAFDLPGFGLSDPHDYAGRTLREHAVAQIGSMLDALGLERATIVGTSLGAMWALCMALEQPERVTSVVGLGIPAVALAGMRGNAFFRAMTTPGVRALASRAPAPKTAKATRRAMAGAIGRPALATLPDSYLEVVRATMLMPGWRLAMSSHLNLAMRSGRARPENLFTDDELRSIRVPVRLILTDRDVYGGPEIGRRAVALMPDAVLDVLPGGHAPFLDDPELCAQLVSSAR